MDDNVVDLVLQWASENGLSATLTALEGETGRSYDANKFERGSELVSRLTIYEELQSIGAGGTSNPTVKLVPGDGVYVREKAQPIQTGQSGNILSVKFSPNPNQPVVAVAAADKTVVVLNHETGERLGSHSAHKAGILALDFHPQKSSILVSAGMEGAHHVFSLEKGDVIQSFQDHIKYISAARFSIDGTLFVTGSYDGTLNIYTVCPENGTLTHCEKIQHSGAVQALCWLHRPDDASGNNMFVFGARDDNYLHYLEIDGSGQVVSREDHNMNMNGDDHVSFAPLDVKCSPDGQYVSVATDRSRIIVFQAQSSIQACNLYGASNDEWSLPRHCWHPSSLYVYCTSQDRQIYIWELATQKVVHKLAGHTNVIRDIDICPRSRRMISGSFDKTALMWQ